MNRLKHQPVATGIRQEMERVGKSIALRSKTQSAAPSASDSAGSSGFRESDSSSIPSNLK